MADKPQLPPLSGFTYRTLYQTFMFMSHYVHVDDFFWLWRKKEKRINWSDKSSCWEVFHLNSFNVIFTAQASSLPFPRPKTRSHYRFDLTQKKNKIKLIWTSVLEKNLGRGNITTITKFFLLSRHRKQKTNTLWLLKA